MQRGFTLIDGMIVAAIIGIIIAIAIPGYQEYKCRESGDRQWMKDIEKRRNERNERIPDCIRIDGKVFCEKEGK